MHNKPCFFEMQNMAALAHELRYELLQREGNRRASITQWSPTAPPDHQDPVIYPDQIHINVQDPRRRSLGERYGLTKCCILKI